MPDPFEFLANQAAELQAAGEELNRCHAELAELQRKLEREREKCAALLAACKKAKIFIEYARYELEDGLAQLGDQFPRKDDATIEIGRLEAAIRKAQP